MGDFGCEDHHEKFSGEEHMDGKHHNSKHLADHERGVGHPAHHTGGQMPSQLNPDHGPHHNGHHHGGHAVHLKKGHHMVGGHHGRGRG